MGVALLVGRLVLASIFVFAGVAKLADLAGSRQAVVAFGVPERFARLVGGGLPLVETAVGVALLVSVSARFGAVGAIALLLCFIGAIAVAVAGGRAPDCHCFGQVHSAPAGRATLARNVVLLGVAAFVAVGGWQSSGISATHWLTRVPAAWVVGIGAGLALAGLVAFQVWFSLQLLAQNGRMIGRLEALEEAVAALGAGEDWPARIADPQPMDLGAGLAGGGLPVGSPAPDFDVPDLDGDRRSLGSVLRDARPVMLVFSDSGCGPCDALMPEVAGWQGDHADRLGVVVMVSGDEQRNRAKAQEHGLGVVLLQPGREVSDAYQAQGTPMAVVIGSDGVIMSPTVGGAQAIRTLVEQATGPVLAVRKPGARGNGRQGSNGNGNGRGVPGPELERSMVGQPAPELVLSDLDGQRVELKDLYQGRTLAIFWNPGCGFCQRMLDDLKAFGADPPGGAPQIVVISSGDLERTREQELGASVLIDPDGLAMSAFDAHGTPMGVLVHDGRIASPVAAGAEAVLALAHQTEDAPLTSDPGDDRDHSHQGAV